eukprot:363783-Chlamydomonas_euryale.AAC.8
MGLGRRLAFCLQTSCLRCLLCLPHKEPCSIARISATKLLGMCKWGQSESESQGADPQRRLCGANANGRNQNQQEAQQRWTQNKHGKGSASALRQKRRTSILQPSQGACLRDLTASHPKADRVLEQ